MYVYMILYTCIHCTVACVVHSRWLPNYVVRAPPLLEAHALPRASSPRQRPRNPRQRLCRGLPSAKTPRGIFRRRRGLCRGPFIGHSAKKRSRQAPVPLAVSLPRADPRQRNGFFFEFFLPRAGPRQRIFFKSLPRASSLALGKEIFRIF